MASPSNSGNTLIKKITFSLPRQTLKGSKPSHEHSPQQTSSSSVSPEPHSIKQTFSGRDFADGVGTAADAESRPWKRARSASANDGLNDAQIDRGGERWQSQMESSGEASSPGSRRRLSGLSGNDKQDILKWHRYSALGEPVAQTRIIPCKTPLEGPLAEKAVRDGLLREEDLFSRTQLLERCARKGWSVGLVIDMCNTSKYYRWDGLVNDVKYKKIAVRGACVPKEQDVTEVLRCIDNFTKANPNRYVVLHCTHGVNRTGFVVVTHLLRCSAIEGRPLSYNEALSAFETARGMQMDKPYLLQSLQELAQEKSQLPASEPSFLRRFACTCQ